MFVFGFLGSHFEQERAEITEKSLCTLRRLRLLLHLRSNKRICEGLAALNSNALSSLTAAASPPLSFFPFNDTSPSATWTQSCRPGASLCARRLPSSSWASQRWPPG